MTRAHSRFISADKLGAVSDWNFGAVDQASARFAAKLKAQAHEEENSKNDVARQAGFSDGYAQGYAQGHAQATLEGQRLIGDYIASQGADAARIFGALFASAQTQIDESQQSLAKGVLELACELARQVLRHEFAANPNTLQPVIREALGLLTADNKAALVRMNPIDVDVLGEALQQEYPGLTLTLYPDVSVTRGGCIVEAAGTVVDGTVEKRWHRVVASLGLDSTWEVPDDVK